MDGVRSEKRGKIWGRSDSNEPPSAQEQSECTHVLMKNTHTFNRNLRTEAFMMKAYISKTKVEKLRYNAKPIDDMHCTIDPTSLFPQVAV